LRLALAHELAHDLHWRRTARARSTLAFHQARGSLDTPEAREARDELAFIEMECDAFSAVTLSALGRNPVLFGRYLEAAARDYSDYLSQDLPPVNFRAKVIAEVVPAGADHLPPQATGAFQKLKTMLTQHPFVKS
jgi:hypothetical protein